MVILLVALSCNPQKDTIHKNDRSNPCGNISFGDRDRDFDYIPDNIEDLIGFDKTDPDQNRNGVKDGLEFDPYFGEQWYISSTGKRVATTSQVSTIAGNDLGLLEVYRSYMGYNLGNPILVQVYEPVDARHEDLAANLDLEHSINHKTGGRDPTPPKNGSAHGTECAGVIAARAFNRLGVRGVAPFAGIAGVLGEGGSFPATDESLADMHYDFVDGPGMDRVDITSWSGYIPYLNSTRPEEFMGLASQTGRRGKGRIFVICSGNSRMDHDNTNYDYIRNNRFVIPVAALGHNNRAAIYSTPGSTVFISAYSSKGRYTDGPAIATTYLTGASKTAAELKGELGPITFDDDSGRNYTFSFSGTSAAAPVAAGALALVLEACPELSWRQLRYLLAETATKIDPDNPSWIKNAAGLSHSNDYGFGLINVKGAICSCLCKIPGEPGPEVAWTGLTLSSQAIPANGTAVMTIPLSGPGPGLIAEWAGITIDSDHPKVPDLEVFLVSPNNTRSLLLPNNPEIDLILQPAEFYIKTMEDQGLADQSPYKEQIAELIKTMAEHQGPFFEGGKRRLASVAFLGEPAQGKWKVEIINHGDQTGTVRSVSLTVYGAKSLPRVRSRR